MAKWFVGQPVRLRAMPLTGIHVDSVPVGTEGRIVSLQFRPKGYPTSVGPLSFDSDCVVDFIQYGLRSTETSRLEPILPEGAAPSEYTAEELFEKLGINVTEGEIV